MTITEAKKIVEDNLFLEEELYKGKTISLLIVPTVENGLGLILKATRQEDDLEIFYNQFSDFNPIAVIGFEQTIDASNIWYGAIQTETIQNILKDLRS